MAFCGIDPFGSAVARAFSVVCACLCVYVCAGMLGEELGVTFSRNLVAALAQVTFKQMGTVAADLQAFARCVATACAG